VTHDTEGVLKAPLIIWQYCSPVLASNYPVNKGQFRQHGQASKLTKIIFDRAHVLVIGGQLNLIGVGGIGVASYLGGLQVPLRLALLLTALQPMGLKKQNALHCSSWSVIGIVTQPHQNFLNSHKHVHCMHVHGSQTGLYSQHRS
jgi:hypothetical protein